MALEKHLHATLSSIEALYGKCLNNVGLYCPSSTKDASACGGQSGRHLNEVLFGSNFGHITTQSNHEVRMSTARGHGNTYIHTYIHTYFTEPPQRGFSGTIIIPSK